MLLSRLEMADAHMVSQQLWLPIQDHVSQSSSQDREGLLRSHALELSSYWLVREGHFSLGIWPMTGWPCPRTHIIQIWSVITRLGLLIKMMIMKTWIWDEDGFLGPGIRAGSWREVLGVIRSKYTANVHEIFKKLLKLRTFLSNENKMEAKVRYSILHKLRQTETERQCSVLSRMLKQNKEAKGLGSLPQLKVCCFRKMCCLNSYAQIYKLIQLKIPFKSHYATGNCVKKILLNP